MVDDADAERDAKRGDLRERLPKVQPRADRSSPVAPPLQVGRPAAAADDEPRGPSRQEFRGPATGAGTTAAGRPRPAPRAASVPLDGDGIEPTRDALETYPDRPAPRVRGLTLPGRVSGMSLGRKLWFGLAFVAPVLIGAFYLFAIVPDQYITEFRFSVRVPVGQPGTIAQGGETLSALFGGNPTPGSDLLDNFTVADYVRSPQAALDLDRKFNLRAMYGKPSDPFSRIGDKPSQQRLGTYWKSMVYSDFDVTTGLAVVRVRAYTAQDSLQIANALLDEATALVNKIGDQSQSDTVRYGRQQVARAQQSVAELRRQTTALSARHGIDSPSLGVISADAGMSTTARQNIASIQGQIGALMQQLHNPNAPQIVMLRQQLVANERTLAAAVDAANAPDTNRFLDARSQLQSALTVLSNAQAALSQSLAAQDAQRLYLTTYVKPQLADAPNAPDRWVSLFLVIVVSAMVWMIGMLVRNSIMEHGA